MPGCRFEFCGAIAFAFDCVDVKQLRTFHVFYFAQSANEFYDIVSVHGSEISYVQSFEYVLLIGYERLQRVVEAYYGFSPAVAQESELYELLRQLEAQPVVARGCVQVAQVLSHSAHAAVNAHSVVV